MITTFFIQMVLGIIDGIFSVVPSWSVSTSTIDGAKSAGLTAGSLDGWFPETFLFGCLAVVLAARLWFFFFNAIQWIWHSLPFNG